MNRRNCWIAVVSALLVTGGVLVAGDASGQTEEGKPAGQVLLVDTHKCNMCHAVPSASIEAKTKSEKLKGPDLGGKIEAELAVIAAYLRQERELDGHQHKKEFKGTDEELQTILDWLGTLEAQESGER